MSGLCAAQKQYREQIAPIKLDRRVGLSEHPHLLWQTFKAGHLLEMIVKGKDLVDA
jgi:hypothetical protein